MVKFSERLRELRVMNNMQQGQLSKLVDLKPSAISKYENGLTQPGIDILKKLADVFNVSVDYLVGNSSVLNPYTYDSVSPQEFEIAIKFRKLSSENKIRIDERLNTLLENQERCISQTSDNQQEIE